MYIFYITCMFTNSVKISHMHGFQIFLWDQHYGVMSALHGSHSLSPGCSTCTLDPQESTGEWTRYVGSCHPHGRPRLNSCLQLLPSHLQNEPAEGRSLSVSLLLLALLSATLHLLLTNVKNSFIQNKLFVPFSTNFLKPSCI